MLETNLKRLLFGVRLPVLTLLLGQNKKYFFITERLLSRLQTKNIEEIIGRRGTGLRRIYNGQADTLDYIDWRKPNQSNKKCNQQLNFKDLAVYNGPSRTETGGNKPGSPLIKCKTKIQVEKKVSKLQEKYWRDSRLKYKYGSELAKKASRTSTLQNRLNLKDGSKEPAACLTVIDTAKELKISDGPGELSPSGGKRRRSTRGTPDYIKKLLKNSSSARNKEKHGELEDKTISSLVRTIEKGSTAYRYQEMGDKVRLEKKNENTEFLYRSATNANRFSTTAVHNTNYRSDETGDSNRQNEKKKTWIEGGEVGKSYKGKKPTTQNSLLVCKSNPQEIKVLTKTGTPGLLFHKRSQNKTEPTDDLKSREMTKKYNSENEEQTRNSETETSTFTSLKDRKNPSGLILGSDSEVAKSNIPRKDLEEKNVDSPVEQDLKPSEGPGKQPPTVSSVLCMSEGPETLVGELKGETDQAQSKVGAYTEVNRKTSLPLTFVAFQDAASGPEVTGAQRSSTEPKSETPTSKPEFSESAVQDRASVELASTQNDTAIAVAQSETCNTEGKSQTDMAHFHESVKEAQPKMEVKANQRSKHIDGIQKVSPPRTKVKIMALSVEKIKLRNMKGNEYASCKRAMKIKDWIKLRKTTSHF